MFPQLILVCHLSHVTAESGFHPPLDQGGLANLQQNSSLKSLDTPSRLVPRVVILRLGDFQHTSERFVVKAFQGRLFDLRLDIERYLNPVGSGRPEIKLI